MPRLVGAALGVWGWIGRIAVSRVIGLGVIIGGCRRRADNRTRGNPRRDRAIPIAVIRISAAVYVRVRPAAVHIGRVADRDVACGSAHRHVAARPDRNPAARRSAHRRPAARTHGGGSTRRSAHSGAPARTDRSTTAPRAAHRTPAAGAADAAHTTPPAIKSATAPARKTS